MDLKNKVLNDQIKPEELRIGNLIYIPETNQVAFISMVHKHLGVYVNDGFIFLGFHQIRKIKLNDEMVKSVGYEFDNDNILKFGNCLYFLDDFLQIASGPAPIVNLKCEFVHELQNAHFALFNNEICFDRNLIEKLR